MILFLDGVIMMAFCTAGFLFLRFWSRTRDRLFMLFSLAFWIMAVNRLMLAFTEHGNAMPNEHRAGLYFVRLVAFGIVLAAIIDKNRKAAADSSFPER